MKLNLTDRTETKSIRDLESPDLPAFTLITGKNGCGKSHLLNAIKTGSIVVDGNHPAGNRPVLRDWTIFQRNLDGPGRVQSRLGHNERLKVSGLYREAQSKLGAVLEADALASALGFDSADLSRLASREEVHQKIQNSGAADRVADILRDADREFRTKLGCILGDRDGGPAGYAIAANERFLLSIPQEELGRFLSPTQPLFEPQLAELFIDYAKRLAALKLEVFDQDADTRKAAVRNFEEICGPRPWVRLSETLRDAGLEIEVEPLVESTPEQYQFVLRKAPKAAKLSPHDLSTGEQVILSLCIAETLAAANAVSESGGKLILLDELDAPLHPAMTQNYLRVINDVLVDGLGCRVIATTHSPSTVAQARDKSVFLLEEDAGKHRLLRVGRNAALAVLTEGVPTLSVDFSGRRQVFCEAELDRDVYSHLFAQWKKRFPRERSLEFVSAAKKKEKGTENGGCTVVCNVVKQLDAGGNRSALGLIDWDGGRNQNVAGNRIVVLAKGTRDGIENLLLDPLLLLACTFLKARNCLPKFDLPPDLGREGMRLLIPQELQKAVHAIQKEILPEGYGEGGESVVEYVGGFKLNVATAYLEMDDHALKMRVLGALPWLKAIENQNTPNDALLRYIAADVSIEFLDFFPIEINIAFNELLDMQI